MNRTNARAHASLALAGARRLLTLLTLCLGLTAFCRTADAISYAQDNYHSTSAPAVAVSVNFPSAQSAGDLVVVAIAWNDQTRSLASVSDTAGNTYIPATPVIAGPSPSMQVLYYAKNVGATTAGSNTLTATFDGPASWAEVRFIEYSGVSTTNALDVTASASGTSANASSGSATTSNANDVIVGANYVQDDTPGAGSGFTEEQYSGYASILEDQYVSATGSYRATAPESPAGWWIMQMAAFRAAGSPAGGDTQAPTAPSNLAAAPVPGNGVQLTWNASTDNTGITAYFVERCLGTSCSNFAQIAAVSGSSYTDITTSVNSSYTYRIRATDAAGNVSGYSTTVSGTSPAIVFVQSNCDFGIGTCGDPTYSTQSVAATLYGPQRTGDLNVVAVAWADSTSHVTSITDTTGNTYVLAVGPTVANGITQSIYYAKNIGAASAGANTITVTFDAIISTPDVRVAEYSGPDTVSPLDQATEATGNSSTPTVGPVTTTSANEVLVGAEFGYEAATGAGSGYTLRVLSDPELDVLEDKAVTSTGAYSASAPMDAGNVWVMSLATFKAPGGGGGDTTPPTAPSGLAATPTASVVNLSWTASTDNVGVTNYFIERCQGAGCSTFTQVGTSSTPSYTDSGLSASTSYNYRVRATDAAGNLSAYSNTATTTTTAGLTAPSGLIVIAASSIEVDLAWTAGSGGSGTISYLLERCSGVSCSSFAQIGAPSATSYSDSSLAASSSYSYRVRATDGEGDLSPYSSILSYTTPAATADCSK